MTGWSLVYDRYDPAEEGRRESLCALGNGHFVTRAAAADCVADTVHYPGTYLAGGYDRLTSRVAGHEIENEDLANLPNWLPLLLRIDGDDWLRSSEATLLDYRQELDLRGGMLRRMLRIQDHAGRITRWEEERLVSMADRNLAALRLQITSENWTGALTVRSAIDGSVVNAGVARYQALESRHLETVERRPADADVVLLRSRMVQSRREIALAARTRFAAATVPQDPPRQAEILDDLIAHDCTVPVMPGEPLTVEKVVALYVSTEPAISEPGLEACRKAAEAPGFETIQTHHRQAWQHLWDDCDVRLDLVGAAGCADEIMANVRLHIFHLLQTVSYHTVDLDVGVPPRGWHGEAYRGHILWDELFIFPFLNLRAPALTRALLRYRYRRLPAARRAARVAGFRGAMFPWQSGSNGREESQRIHLNPVSGRWIPDDSRRQRHIGAAIAYNVWQYYQVTDDHAFMSSYGTEMLAEIARFWASIAELDDASDRYDIRGVMGPDEFHTAYCPPDRPGGGDGSHQEPEHGGGIDNNAYTNVMASWVLARAMDALALLPDQRRRHLCERLALDDDEIETWDTISRRLRVPFHDGGIISQFAGYERLENLDWESVCRRHGTVQRLDRVLEAEGDTPNRYQVSKQADVLMLFYLFSADELAHIFERLGYPFDHGMIPRNIDYYARRTAHGSTLSSVVHSWVMARADRRRSWELFCAALASDLDDVQGGTTAEGIHLGAMAGTVDTLQRCYTGIETRENTLHIDPRLPDEVQRLETQVRYRQQILDIAIDQHVLEVTSRPVTALPVTIAYRGHVRRIGPGQCHRFRLIEPPRERFGDSLGASPPSPLQRRRPP